MFLLPLSCLVKNLKLFWQLLFISTVHNSSSKPLPPKTNILSCRVPSWWCSQGFSRPAPWCCPTASQARKLRRSNRKHCMPPTAGLEISNLNPFILILSSLILEHLKDLTVMGGWVAAVDKWREWEMVKKFDLWKLFAIGNLFMVRIIPVTWDVYSSQEPFPSELDWHPPVSQSLPPTIDAAAPCLSN